jgi:hypothetical protein
MWDLFALNNKILKKIEKNKIHMCTQIIKVDLFLKKS